MMSDNFDEPLCFGGKATMDYITDSWKASSQSGVPLKTESSGMLEDLEQWMECMSYVERVCWAVGGMVLTAGLFFIGSDKPLSEFLL